jgi:hypothetical protein
MRIQFLGLAAAMALAVGPVAAHHNCNAGDSCPDEIGDVMENHEEAISSMLDRMGGIEPDGNTAGQNTAMDPADGLDGAGYGDIVDDGAGSLAQPRR